MMAKMNVTGIRKWREIPAGSLFFNAATGTLALMTEYGDNDGKRHAYIVGTGETYWQRDTDDHYVCFDLVVNDEDDAP